MGYVGVVSGACLLRDGHSVIGVDPQEQKVRDLAAGITPIQEPGVAEMIAAGHAAGRLRATTDPGEGVRHQDMIFVCVGTPSKPDGAIDLSHVQACMAEIGQAMKETGARPLVVLRSTSLPGSTDGMVVPTLEESSGLKAGEDFHVVFHPEFLREGTAVADFDAPPKIVVGEQVPGAGDLLMQLYGDEYQAPRFRLTPAEAEMVKYCDNAFHAVKVTFANEAAAIAHEAGIDARRVAEVFCSDTKLNISARYLRPGFAYGGSCLPKDVEAITRHASLRAIQVPMLQALQDSNALQIESLVRRVLEHRPRTVGMVGLAFKPDTDDMRESPFVKVAKSLIGEGVEVRIWDPVVDTAKLVGANRDMVLQALGHLETLLVGDIDDLDACELILVNHPTIDAARVRAWTTAGQRVVDLASIPDVPRELENYEGISW